MAAMSGKAKRAQNFESDFRCLTKPRRSAVDANFGCGIALVSGRYVIGEIFESDSWQDELFAPLSTELAVELISWDAMRQFSQFELVRRQEFMSWLGLHPDARLRALTAGEPWIADEIVKKLAVDPAYAVRSALSQNPPVVAGMKTPLLTSMACGDAELIANLGRSLTEAFELKMQEYGCTKGQRPYSVEDFNRIHHMPREIDKLREKIEEFIGIFGGHADPSVRQSIRELDARVNELLDSPEDTDRRRALRRGRRSFFRGESKTFHRLDAYDYALAYLTIDEQNGKIAVNRNIGAMMLSLEALENAACELPTGQASDEIILRLAEHSSGIVRAAVASRDGLPPQVVELLKKDTTYAVRRALLNNEAVLVELSSEEILQILGDDPGLLEDAFALRCPSTRISRLLRERFAESGDPYVREIVSKLDD